MSVCRQRSEPTDGDVAYVNVSDGLGVGIVVRGELVRGRHNVAGEFGALDPARIYLGGEIISAWDLIEPSVRQAIGSRTLAPAAAAIELVTVPATDYPRLRGAAALVAAPLFTAPAVA